MAKLIIEIEAGSAFIPSIVDPEDIALDILSEYNDMCHSNATMDETVTLLSAEWSAIK